MNLHDFFVTIGLDPAILGAGAAGGLLRSLSRKRFKVREVFLSPICGTLAAGYLTPWAVHIVRFYEWPPMPDDGSAVYAMAFLIGTVAMWLSDLLFDAIVRRVKGDAPSS
ncbi:hypothetical protein [Mesorhizobium sp. SP-1A]|uniref:hypothetical protein n=1 Tax=Mesorhizobium sp. SP-1A TaxID=3077840 RepID=UPI0028F6D4E4|nr:hypothetical protein [Mesorhizobium sp. SP-1A]